MALPQHYNPIEAEREFFRFSKKDLPIFIRFFLLYASFNSRIARESGKIYDYEMIKWVKLQRSLYRRKFIELLENDDFKSWLSQLTNVRVVNVREIKKRENALRAGKQYNYDKPTYHQLIDINDFNTMIDIIYQVRCNLFHGAKSIENRMELGLIELCYNILNALYSPFINRC